MNIFYLDHDPMIAAQMHCDKHCVKMIVEYAQLLSTAHRVLDGVLYNDKTANGRNIKRWKLEDGRERHLYKASHINHPSAVWCRDNDKNYRWLFELYYRLCWEYQRRYGREHKTYELREHISISPNNIVRNLPFTEPPPAMPDYCKVEGDSVASYRNYYIKEKASFAKWNHCEVPYWYSLQTI